VNGNSVKKTQYEWVEGKGSPSEIFLNAAVDSDVEIGWFLRKPDADAITIVVGRGQVHLEFFDLESLRRMCDVANDALTRLAVARDERARVMAEDRLQWATGHAASGSVAGEEPLNGPGSDT
jgi:hypothetical protein